MIRLLVVIAATIAAVGSMRADDFDEARAALALASPSPRPPVIRDAVGRGAIQMAKAALAEAAGRECDCGVCDSARPMPAATPPPTKVSYEDLVDRVGKLPTGESVRVFAGREVVADPGYTGTVYQVDQIPGEASAVWRCWRSGSNLQMQRLHLDAEPKPTPAPAPAPAPTPTVHGTLTPTIVSPTVIAPTCPTCRPVPIRR